MRVHAAGGGDYTSIRIDMYMWMHNNSSSTGYHRITQNMPHISSHRCNRLSYICIRTDRWMHTNSSSQHEHTRHRMRHMNTDIHTCDTYISAPTVATDPMQTYTSLQCSCASCCCHPVSCLCMYSITACIQQHEIEARFNSAQSIARCDCTAVNGHGRLVRQLVSFDSLACM